MKPQLHQGGLQHLVLAKGGVGEAVESLRAYFADRFCGAPPLSQELLPWQDLGASCEMLPGIPELQLHIAKLQSGKTTGPSGVSTDFLINLWAVPGGAEVVRAAVCELLCHPESAVQQFDGLVLLLAKERLVTQPKQVRPIVLTEALTKLTARVAASRVLSSWPLPPEMLGGRTGGQVAKALWIAKRMVMHSSMF